MIDHLIQYRLTWGVLEIGPPLNELNGSVKEPNKFHNYETEKITRKASDAAENLISSCSVLPPEIVMHNDAYIGRHSQNNIKCIVHDDLG